MSGGDGGRVWGDDTGVWERRVRMDADRDTKMAKRLASRSI